jgi:hypothetical protein
MRPPGASSIRWVSGSCIGSMQASSNTVATQIELEPDMGGVSSGSMMMKPICALGSLAGTSRFTWRKTPPRGSLRTKLRKAPSLAMKRDCSHKVSPGGGATPPTITSPTSPSAWQVTTWMILEDRMISTGARLRKLLMSSLSALGLQQRLAGDLLVHRVGGASQTQLTSAWYAANFWNRGYAGIQSQRL